VITEEQYVNYLPWYVAFACLGLVVSSRVLTNHYINLHRHEILNIGVQPGFCPRWVSSLYLLGVLGLFASGIWSFVIAWWAPIPVVAAYFLQMVLIPSAILSAIQDSSDKRATDAVHHAVNEMHSVLEQLKAPNQSEKLTPTLDESISRAMSAVNQATPLIDAVSDPKKKDGLLMFLQIEIERVQATINSMKS